MYKFIILLILTNVLLSCSTVKLSESRIECNKLLISESNRIEIAYRDTADKYNKKIKKIFESATKTTKNKEMLKILISTYNSMINTTIKPEIEKLEGMPDTFIRISEGDTYPKMCDKPQELKKISNQAINSYEYIWRKTLDLAVHTINTANK